MKTSGLTLLEVLVAFAILGITMIAIVPSFVRYLQVNSASEVRTQAANVAQRYFEQYRLMDPGSMPTSGQETASASLGGRDFEVTTTYCVQPSYCGAGSRDIQVEVQHNGTTVFSAETVYTQVNVETK
jgi:type II secretory pathway pseudopilin PulG